MTSSLRNSLHRRNHKERSQLSNRTKLGLLEKHKDYVKRARDYHSKQDRINRLKEKAAGRNRDEFYFGMNRQKTKGGVHVHERGNVALPTDMVKVLKSQDENYIRMKRHQGQKKIDGLKARLSMLADLTSGLDEEETKTLKDAGLIPGPSKGKRKGKSGPKKIVFESEEKGDLAEEQEEEPEAGPSRIQSTALGWKVEQPTTKRRESPDTNIDESLDDSGELSQVRVSTRSMTTPTNKKQDTRSTLIKELSARLTRDKLLRYALRELEMQKQLMSKGASQKISSVEKLASSDQEDEDEDEQDSSWNKKRKKEKEIGMENYRPRVYKWRLERKK
ncbi:small-subunit processome [Sistotremastrum suecicum HHB10207 ss-3]|uniref:Small-subunit processome n=1 Tax=Sistotremastrum suecicum HHB10207 ss-3 TaxID=1314776 RepID=A0A166BNK6_9AGAM|nr:small-subunit processome [Sistotremastrum suecicum HHB10207 ss-3]